MRIVVLIVVLIYIISPLDSLVCGKEAIEV